MRQQDHYANQLPILIIDTIYTSTTTEGIILIARLSIFIFITHFYMLVNYLMINNNLLKYVDLIFIFNYIILSNY